MTKTRLIFVLSLFLAVSVSAKNEKFQPPPSDRVKTNIDFDWKFINRDFPAEEETHQVNALPWQKVDLPHDWTIEGPYDPENNTTQGFMPMNVGWYIKNFIFPESYAGKKIFIVFDGVYRASDVWMNYAFLGHHESGYTSFAYDLTDYVRTGNVIPNGLRVRVDGRRHEEDMYEGNGIYRHVWLVLTNKLHVDNCGTFVSTPKVSKSVATIKVQTKIKNENEGLRNCKLVTKIVDADGYVVAEMTSSRTMAAKTEYEFTQSTELTSPHLWNLDDPYLYRAHSIVYDGVEVVDTYATTFGIRTFYFDANKGFFLNGEHVQLRGFNAHYDYAGLGTALPDRIHWNAMMAMKKAGFNCYRSSHNPATPERLDVCDRIGMLVWDEIERKLESKEIELALVRETITRDRNHPSLILWSLENESPLESTVFGTSILQAATQLAHELDPTRPTTFAASMHVNKNGYGDAVDVVCYNYYWRRADEDHLSFPHWKIGGLSEYSAARGRRGVYGVEKFDRAEEDSYFDLYSGEVQTMYEMCARAEEYWRRIKARPYMAGGWLWSGIDSWGEGGAWPLISRGDGALDLCHFPKDVYYYFVSQWTKEPIVHLFPHWNWQRRTDQPIEVWCYSNCDSVELFLNDRSLGFRRKAPEPEPWSPKASANIPTEKSETFPEHLAWQVPYEPGTLRAVGVRDGERICQEELHTAGKPAKIILSQVMNEFVSEEEIPPLTADGRDVAIIKAAIVDQNDHLVPTADNLVNFYVEGEEKIIGVGNGNITSHEPNKVSYRKAYNGLCAVIVQTTTEPDDFRIVATSPRLVSGKISLMSIAPEPVSIVLDAKPMKLPTTSVEAVVTAEVRDRFGGIVNTATNSVTFKLDGPATFESGLLEEDVYAVNGKAMVKIKSFGKKGKVMIVAFGIELVPGRVQITVER